jgi:hypothetical protein
MDVTAGAIKRSLIGLALVLVWMAAGCTDGSRPQAGGGSSSSAPVTTHGSPLSARIELPSHVLKAGDMMQGQVVVTNNGEVVTATGCGSLFAVALSSPTYTPQIAWAACGQTLTIPPGVSTYPINFFAGTFACQNDAPTSSAATESSYPPCIDSHPPALPPGDYEARLYQSTSVVPDPEPVPASVVR